MSTSNPSGMLSGKGAGGKQEEVEEEERDVLEEALEQGATPVVPWAREWMEE